MYLWTLVIRLSDLNLCSMILKRQLFLRTKIRTGKIPSTFAQVISLDEDWVKHREAF